MWSPGDLGLRAVSLELSLAPPLPGTQHVGSTAPLPTIDEDACAGDFPDDHPREDQQTRRQKLKKALRLLQIAIRCQKRGDEYLEKVAASLAEAAKLYKETREMYESAYRDIQHMISSMDNLASGSSSACPWGHADDTNTSRPGSEVRNLKDKILHTESRQKRRIIRSGGTEEPTRDSFVGVGAAAIGSMQNLGSQVLQQQIAATAGSALPRPPPRQ